MRQQVSKATVVAIFAIGSLISTPVPALAAPTWTMPESLKGLTLKQAQNALAPFTEAGLTLHTQNVTGPAEEQLNPTNWIVCWQSPKPGKTVTQKTWLALGVRRPDTKCY